MPFAEASIVEWLRITFSLHHSRFEACGLPAGGNVRRGIATAWSGIMSVTNALDLNRLPSQELAQQAQDSPTNTGAALAVPTSALPQDQFTPSSSIESADTTAQAAGIFSAPKTSALPSSGASLVQPPTNSSATVALPSRTSTQAAGTGSSGANASSANAESASGSQDATRSTSSPSTTSTSTATGSVAQQTQLNALNNALAALGLSAADIRQIDRVASLINDFNPTTFTSLAYQLESQVQNSTAPSASARNTQAAVAGASATSTSSTSTAATPPALQSFSSSPQSGSNSQSAQGNAAAATTTARAGPKATAAIA